METLLGELGKRLPDRWLARVGLPALLWLAAAACGHVLGHTDALDATALVQWAETQASGLAGRPVAIALAIVAALLAVAVVGLVARGVVRVLSAVWLGRWSHAAALADRLARRRRQRAKARIAADSEMPARYLPARPTWIGDRIHLTDQRIQAQYGLLLGLVWPRLWQVLDEPARSSVQAARDRFDHAVESAGWGLMFAGVGVTWWPALLAGTGVFLVAWRQAREAIATFAYIVEATVDTHHRALAEALGVALPHGQLTPTEAAVINDQLNKGA